VVFFGPILKTSASITNAARGAPRDPLSPRERVLQTASDLFYKHGINSVGVDRIITQSGVAKMTFYRHFPSKVKLVAEYLGRKNESWIQLLDEITGDESKPALQRLLALFDMLESVIKNPEFFGCPFIKTLSEFGPERNDPEVQQRLARHFTQTEEAVARLLKEIRPRDWKKLVPPLLSLITGTIVVAQATGKTDIAAKNRDLVKVLLAE
jgi:AcrR family transcriptional regulator